MKNLIYILYKRCTHPVVYREHDFLIENVTMTNCGMYKQTSFVFIFAWYVRNMTMNEIMN